MLDRVDRRLRNALGSVAAIAGIRDGLCVETERDVVEEQLLSDTADVDPHLDTVEGRLECLQRIAAIEAEVHGEVVPGADRYHGHRNAVLDRHLRDCGEGSVSATDEEMIAPGLDRLLGQLGEVLVAATFHRLDAEVVGCVDESVPLRLATAAVRIDDEQRSTGGSRPDGRGRQVWPPAADEHDTGCYHGNGGGCPYDATNSWGPHGGNYGTRRQPCCNRVAGPGSPSARRGSDTVGA